MCTVQLKKEIQKKKEREGGRNERKKDGINEREKQNSREFYF